MQAIPVGRRLYADAFDRHVLALDAEQPLHAALQLLVAALAEVVERMTPFASMKYSAGH